METKTLTIPQPAERLTIGETTLRRHSKQRLLSYIVLPGNDHRIKPKEIEEFKKSAHDSSTREVTGAGMLGSAHKIPDALEE